MSVNAEVFVGFSVDLDYRNHYDDVDEFCDKHPEYDRYSPSYKNTVRFIVDGMCGDYIRLMYIVNYIDIEYADGYSHYDTLDVDVDLYSQGIYDKLNEPYKEIFKKDLNIDDIKFITFVHYS